MNAAGNILTSQKERSMRWCSAACASALASTSNFSPSRNSANGSSQAPHQSPVPLGEYKANVLGRASGSVFFQVRMALRFLHPPVFSLNAYAVFARSFKLCETGKGGGRSPNPCPQLFTDLAQVQPLAELHEINDRAVIAVIPHRKINVV